MPATRVTWQDVLTMPEDGNRYEAIGGQLVMSPPPRVRHQLVTERLLGALRDILVQAGHGYLFPAPVGVVFPGTAEGVQPDIVFVTKERANIIKEDAIEGAPDLVIEILSPSTARRDRTVKRHLYERQGVAQYWIVDIDARQVEVWRFGTGATDAEHHTNSVSVRLGDQLLGEVQLAGLFDWPGGSDG